MRSLANFTWRSITVLPPLIAASTCVVLILAVWQKLPLHHGFGLLVSLLALVEIGYLVVLILANRWAQTNVVRNPPRQ